MTNPNEAKDAHHERAANMAHEDAAQREAYDYWGYLLRDDKCGTPTLDRLLKGLAEVISKKFEPSDSPDLTPGQIAAFYRDVGGDFDVLFTDTPPSSIAFIYRSLGALHSLQPAPKDDGYGTPAIPALKKQGFVTWQTIQLLLGPEEHVPFLQKAVEIYDVVDPETKSVFPKILPKKCFPDRPDDAMVEWYQGVADRLKREAEEEASGGVRLTEEKAPRTSTEQSDNGSSADEKRGAFRYFEDPMYRRSRQRPIFMRHVSKQPSRPMEEQGDMVTRVRRMLNPFGRKKGPPGHYESDSLSDDDATPIAVVPPQAVRYTSHKRPHAHRPDNYSSTTDSDSEADQPPSRRRTPPLRHRRSHDPPTSPLEYFPAYHDGNRRYSHQPEPNGRVSGRSSKATSPQPMYGPTQSPMFATQIAHLEARNNYYDRRPSMPPRSSYRPVRSGVRWSSESRGPSPLRHGSRGDRDRDRDRDRERHRDENRDGAPAYESGRSGPYHRTRRRRSTEDAVYARERDEKNNARTRSHDRVKDEWDSRDDSREASRSRSRDDSRERSKDRDRTRDRDRERDRESRAHRYVSGVEGRRYPIVNAPY